MGRICVSLAGMTIGNQLPTMDHWSTAQVSAQGRFSFWVEAICEAFLKMECDSEDADHFVGDLSRLVHPQMHFNRVRASSQHVYRTSRDISASGHAPFYFISDVSHAWQISQDGHCAQLRPGDGVLLDASRPYEFEFQGGVSCLSIEIQRQSLARWLNVPEAKGLRITRFDQGWGGSIAAMAKPLVQDLRSIHAWPIDVLVEHTGALLCAALDGERPQADRVQLDLYGRALQLMRAQLENDGLEAAHIARQLHVSARTLQRCFAANQKTFMQELQRLRLELAAQMLRQPNLRRVNTSEIGWRCGFMDPSHFVRAFAKIHGQTPLHWRKKS